MSVTGDMLEGGVLIGSRDLAVIPAGMPHGIRRIDSRGLFPLAVKVPAEA